MLRLLVSRLLPLVVPVWLCGCADDPIVHPGSSRVQRAFSDLSPDTFSLGMAESMGTDNARNHAIIVGVTLGWRLRPERTVKVGNAAGADSTPMPTPVH